jgi:hypothetical protein
VIVIGPGIPDVRELDRERDAALRFHLGRVVELARPRRVFAASRGLDDASRPARAGGLDDFTQLVAALASFATKPDDKLHAKLSVALRKKLAEQVAAAGTLDAARYAAACTRAADRAGLIACGDLAIAVEQAGGLDRARHLVELASSKRYLDVRRKLNR